MEPAKQSFEMSDIRRISVEWIASSVGEVVRPVFQHFLPAAAAFVLVMVVFGYRAMTTPDEFQTSATLVITPPALEEAGPAADIMPESLDIPSYARLLRTNAVLMEAAENAIERDSELWKRMVENESITPELLRNWCTVGTQITEKTPQRITYSRIVDLNVTAPRIEMARQLAEEWAAVSMRIVQEITVPGAEATVEFVRDHYTQARKDLEQKETELRDQQTAWNVTQMETLKTELETHLAELKEELNLAKVEHSGARAEYAALSEKLADEDPTVVLKRIPSVDALSIASAAGEAPGTAKVYEDEIVNQAWVRLRDRSTEAAGLMEKAGAEVEALTMTIADLESELEDLNRTLVTQTLREKQFAREVTSGEEYLAQLAGLREMAASLEASAHMDRASTVTMVGDVIAPIRPKNGLSRIVTLFIGAVVGIVAAIAVANLAYEVKRLRGTAAAPTG